EARRNEDLIFRVLDTSADAEERAVAAEAVGYLRQSRRQLDALVKAALDPNEEVRNNAVRAIGVLLNARPELRGMVRIKPFIDLLNSGTWTDRNKGLMVAFTLAQGRDTKVLRDLTSQATDSLIEMAQWYKGHAFAARMILGWAAGLDDTKLHQMVDE